MSTAITSNPEKLIFAIDGAVAEARTAAFFANDTAPLTSRTIQYISQSTNTQREVESDPSITNINSPLAGPGKCARGYLRSAENFPGIQNTSLVDLFNIEETNRDSTEKPMYDANGNVIGFTPLAQRFNINPEVHPRGPGGEPADRSAQQRAHESDPRHAELRPASSPLQRRKVLRTVRPGARHRHAAGRHSDLRERCGRPATRRSSSAASPASSSPGTTGFADEENSALDSNHNPNKIDLSMVAEYDAFAAVGGSKGAGFSIGTLGGVAPIPRFDLPFGQINLQSIQLKPLFRALEDRTAPSSSSSSASSWASATRTASR